MKPNHFIDIQIIRLGNSEDMSSPALRGRLLSILHSLFRQNPGTYALAIPSGRQSLRIFATEAPELESLRANLSSMPWIRDYARIGDVAAVPQEFKGPWVSYQRYRIPTVKSDRNAVDGISKLRDRRLQSAFDAGNDYFNIYSGSTKQRFTLIVRSLIGIPIKSDVVPNSYGLGSTENPVFLPQLD